MRKISMVFIIVLSFGLLAACSNSSNSGEAEDLTMPENPEDVEGDINVWAWALEANYLKEDVLPAFEKKYPNVNVTIEKLGVDAVYEKLNAGFAGGGSGLPDVFQIENNRIQSFTKPFPDGLTNLNELGFEEEHGDKFPQAKVEGLKDADGNIVAAPRDLGPVGVFYRTDLFKEAGVDPLTIETWDDYIAAGKKVVEMTGKAFFGMQGDELLRIMLQQQGSYYFDDQGKIDITSGAAKKAMTKIAEMKKADLITYTNNWDGQVAAMKNGEVATHPGAVWWSGTMLEQMPELAGKWGMFNLPAFEAGGNRAANDGGSALAIPSYSEEKLAAYAFVEFATTNADLQVKSLENRGLFPSLTETYDEPIFTENHKYFNNQPIFKQFAETVENINPINFTSDNLAARDIMSDQVVALLLEGKSPEAVLEEGEKLVQQQSGKELK